MTNQLTLSLGEQRKQAGQRIVRTNHSEWITLATLFVEALESGVAVDAERIREWVGSPPHPNAMGALLSLLQRTNAIKRTGYRIASRPQRHAAEIKTFQRT